MGASGWSYWTGYTEDIEEFFEELRHEVFAAGDYAEPWDAPDDYHPASIEKLVENCGESGTHSILDIEEIRSKPVPHDAEWDDEFLKLFPLSPHQLREQFDTIRPTREEIEDKEAELSNMEIGNWSGRWIVAYENKEPVEVYIFGHSGD